jgi:S1-C subfamily serine protease
VQLVVFRGATQQTLSIKPTEERSELDSVSAMADPEKGLVPQLGILGVEIDPRIAAAAKGLRDPYGIIVVARAAGASSEVPLQQRDIIRSVNNRPIFTLEVLKESVRSLKPGTPVTLQVQRDGKLTYVSFTFE